MERPRLFSDEPAVLDALGRVEVLYSDLDGTLVAKGGCLLADAEGSPSVAVAEAVVEVNRAGLTVVPVSGRGRVQLTEFVRICGWTDFIAEAGAILAHGVGAGQQVRYNNADWPEALLAAGETPFELIERSGAFEALVAEFPGLLEPHDPWHYGREATHLLRGCLDLERAQEILDGLDLRVGILDNGIVRTTGTLECGDGHLPHAYHLVPKGVTKAQAIQLDLAWRGLSSDQAAAIGDSATDIEMADAVGTMVLVDNAFESRGVTDVLGRRRRENVWRTSARRGEGWAEFARQWLAKRQAGRSR